MRAATPADAGAIAGIYNEGIAEREATFETGERTAADVEAWFTGEGPFLVAEDEHGEILGFARVSAYSARCTARRGSRRSGSSAAMAGWTANGVTACSSSGCSARRRWTDTPAAGPYGSDRLQLLP